MRVNTGNISPASLRHGQHVTCRYTQGHKNDSTNNILRQPLLVPVPFDFPSSHVLPTPEHACMITELCKHSCHGRGRRRPLLNFTYPVVFHVNVYYCAWVRSLAPRETAASPMSCVYLGRRTVLGRPHVAKLCLCPVLVCYSVLYSGPPTSTRQIADGHPP